MKAKYIEWRPDMTPEEQAQLAAYDAEDLENTRRWYEGYTLYKGVKVPNRFQSEYDPRNPEKTVIPELGYDPWRHHSKEEWEKEKEERNRKAAEAQREADRRAEEDRRARDPVIQAERKLAADARYYAKDIRKAMSNAGIRLQYALRNTPDGVDVGVFPVGMPIPPPYTKIRASEAQELAGRVVSRYGHGLADATSKAELMNWIIARSAVQRAKDFHRIRNQNMAKQQAKELAARSAAVAAAAPAPAPARDTVVMTQAQLDRMVPR